jgi:hypothetical protein
VNAFPEKVSSRMPDHCEERSKPKRANLAFRAGFRQ